MSHHTATVRWTLTDNGWRPMGQPDTLRIVFQDAHPVAESNEDKPGIILDDDARGKPTLKS